MVQRYAFFFDYTNFCVNLYLLTLIFPVTTPLPLAYHPAHSYSFPTTFLPVFCNCDTGFLLFFEQLSVFLLKITTTKTHSFQIKCKYYVVFLRIYKYQKYNNITYKCSIKIVCIYVKNML